MKKVTVTQNEDEQVTVEILAESIKAIAEGIDKLLKGPLKRSALVLLIRNAAPKVKGKNQYSPKTLISASDVEAVLEGIQNLKKEFLK